MADGFKLPRIRAADTISDKAGKAANAFVRFWDTVMKAIERQENAQDGVLKQLAEQLALIQQAQAAAAAAQERSDEAYARADLANGGRYIDLTSLAGGSSAGSSPQNIATEMLLSLSGVLSGGSLSANAEWTGTATLTETNSGATRPIGSPVPVTVSSAGLQNPDGSWQAEDSLPIIIDGKGELTGVVTYALSVARTGGPAYVSGAVISATAVLTPKAA
ncbi:hypothetical protein [Brevundimonas diminuta]|uniref:hypothetical protein n=1 Tax=Brevundimonas diminuta TaxID=293 RepID=UPI001F560242|nr:hypothetical protein [Brevundimonas diminuta]